MTQVYIRLAYTLLLAGRTQRYVLTPYRSHGAEPLTDSQLKALRPQLHPLDIAIANEMSGGQMFGHISDAQLARLLPLLVQRGALVDGVRLVMTEVQLAPRIRLDQSEFGGFCLNLGLQGPPGMDWVDVTDGRLLAGSQAFFLREGRLYPVISPAPWELATFARNPRMEISGDRLGQFERDALVRDLAKAGIPTDDLESLAVKRGPPQKVVVRLLAVDPESIAATNPEAKDEPMVRAVILAQYGEDLVVIDGVRPVSAVASRLSSSAGGPQQMLERDLVAEEQARDVMRLAGLRYERESNAFIARGEAALAVLDPRSQVFPSHWEIERSASPQIFHRDLALRASVSLIEERGLFDLRIGFDTVNDDAAVQALVSMKELLAWLHSGKRYVRLADGSYVAPSAQFREGLNILGDLGAESERALVSPLCIGLLRAIGDRGALAAADDATKAWLDELSGASMPQVVEPPSELQVTLRDYQRRGLDWLMMLHRHRLTGILADDMGLGKTLQTLSLLLKVRAAEGRKPSLVVAPTSVVSVWRDEAQRFAPELKVELWFGPPKLRQAVDVETTDLLVTSYGILRRDADILAEIGFRYVILDEAQSAKNATSHNAKSVRRLKSERRLALTGTPIENRPEELWATFDFLAPGFLGTMRQFRKRYARSIARGETEALNLLRMRMQPLVLRRLKGDVAKELPPKIESVVRCDMDSAQRALYDHIAGELRESVQQKIEQVGIDRAQLDILAALTRLRQICCDPALLPAPVGTTVPPSAKLALFEELMREALGSERCVIVFSQFVEMQKRIIEVVRRLGVEPLWLHGGTRNRDEVVAQFQDPKGPPVIVVSLRAGGTGLTLTRADTVMLYDPWWNPAVERQATDRAHRLGQKKRVTVYKLVCSRSIEERVLQLAERKEALARELLGSEGGAWGKHITKDDVLALIS